MVRAKLKMTAIPLLLVAVAVGVGMVARGAGSTRPAEEASKNGPDPGANPRPGVDHVDRLDLGEVRVGALAEAQVGVNFKGVQDADLAVRIERPAFVSVMTLRAFRRGAEQPGVVYCAVTLAVDTRSPGRRSGDLRVRLGEQVATIPVLASVAPEEKGRTKVLVVSGGFGSMSHKADYNRPWFDLVGGARLDVSYMESFGGLSFPDWRPGPDGRPVLPEGLARYDVIFLADGGTNFLDDTAILILNRFVESGRRLVLTASPGHSGSVLHANRILDSYGISMLNEEVRIKPGASRIEADRVAADPLTAGVEKLTTFRPAPIQIRDANKAKLLASLPDRRDGFLAVSRAGGGDVVALGVVLVSSWIGERGEGTDNARLLRNLLSKPRRE